MSTNRNEIDLSTIVHRLLHSGWHVRTGATRIEVRALPDGPVALVIEPTYVDSRGYVRADRGLMTYGPPGNVRRLPAGARVDQAELLIRYALTPAVAARLRAHLEAAQ